MPTDRDELVPNVDELDRTEGADYMRTGVLAIMQAVPFGGAFAQLLGDKIPSRRQRRYEAAVKAIAHAIGQLSDRIDEAAIGSDQFADLVEDVMERLETRRAAEKRDNYAAVLANALTPARPDPEDQERMLATLDELRPAHLWLLRQLMVTTYDTSDLQDDHINQYDLLAALNTRGANLEAVERDWADLVRHNILEPHPGSFVGRHGAADPRSLMTPFGLCFFAFVTLSPTGPSQRSADVAAPVARH